MGTHIAPINIVILIGVILAITLGTAAVLLLRTFFTIRISYAEVSERREISWKAYRPIRRFLDPADFDYLRRCGIAGDRIKKLKSERRRLYRQSLRSLARDFNQVHRMLRLALIQSPVDRPDLAAELARQRFTFYRNLLLVEFRLALNVCGFDRIPPIDMLQPLQILQTRLAQLGSTSRLP